MTGTFTSREGFSIMEISDDEIMMRDNNSSCFNYRLISNTNTISKHGLGMAVDINALYNPYHKFVEQEDGRRMEVIATY